MTIVLESKNDSFIFVVENNTCIFAFTIDGRMVKGIKTIFSLKYYCRIDHFVPRSIFFKHIITVFFYQAVSYQYLLVSYWKTIIAISNNASVLCIFHLVCNSGAKNLLSIL